MKKNISIGSNSHIQFSEKARLESIVIDTIVIPKCRTSELGEFL